MHVYFKFKYHTLERSVKFCVKYHLNDHVQCHIVLFAK